MINWIKNMFRSREPTIGRAYVPKSWFGNPFLEWVVVVDDVRSGFVLYHFYTLEGRKHSTERHSDSVRDFMLRNVEYGDL